MTVSGGFSSIGHRAQAPASRLRRLVMARMLLADDHAGIRLV
jgi:hypothetical protein